jgi:hypothetical protein
VTDGSSPARMFEVSRMSVVDHQSRVKTSASQLTLKLDVPVHKTDAVHELDCL